MQEIIGIVEDKGELSECGNHERELNIGVEDET